MYNKLTLISKLVTSTVLVALVVLQIPVASAAVLQKTFTKISNPESPSLVQGDNISALPKISADGRYVTFASLAENLVADDTNGVADVFVRDLQTGIITRVSVDSAGNEGDGDSYESSISADGRYVAFTSSATNLVTGDTNGVQDIFLYDTQTGTTTRVSVDSAGNEGDGDSYESSISADGRYVVFRSEATNLVAGDTNGATDIFLHDTQTDTTTRVSVDSAGNEGDGDSYESSISADGRYVAFASDATNLVAGDTNNNGDVFLHDTQTGTTTRVSVDSAGNEGSNSSYSPSISADGRYVAFRSDATNLVVGDMNNQTDMFVKNITTGAIQKIPTLGDIGFGDKPQAVISGDGSYVVFNTDNVITAGDINSVDDVFVYNVQSNTVERITQDAFGNEGDSASSNPVISANGQYIAFASNASNLVSENIGGIQNIFRYQFLQDVEPEPPAPTPTPGGIVSYARVCNDPKATNYTTGPGYGDPSVCIYANPTSITTSTTPTTLTTPKTPSTFVFTRSLRFGMRGEDVRQLQIYLNTNGYTVSTTGPGSLGKETTYFGLATVRALIRFQEAHAQLILTPLGLTKGTGFFGAATMKVMK